MGTEVSICHSFKKQDFIAKCQPVFGVPLQRMREGDQLHDGIPILLKRIIEILGKRGLNEFGIFAKSGSVLKNKKLSRRLACGKFVDLEKEDIFVVCDLFKLYLRELPDGVIPLKFSEQIYLALKDCRGKADVLELLKKTIHSLPKNNYNLLSHVLHLMTELANHREQNGMLPKNLASVFGPCIFRIAESPRMQEHQMVFNVITLLLLENHTDLLPIIKDKEITFSDEHTAQVFTTDLPLTIRTQKEGRHG